MCHTTSTRNVRLTAGAGQLAPLYEKRGLQVDRHSINPGLLKVYLKKENSSCLVNGYKPA